MKYSRIHFSKLAAIGSERCAGQHTCVYQGMESSGLLSPGRVQSCFLVFQITTVLPGHYFVLYFSIPFTQQSQLGFCNTRERVIMFINIFLGTKD